MLETIKQYGVVNESVLKAMMQVERHLFIPEDLLSKAYGDYPLSIGYGQTISQPFIVAYMAELSEASKSLNILEIGCGSGYEAAVLANLYKQVYSIENIAALAESSSHLLQQLKYDNVSVIYGNGFLGLEEKAPFDRIILSACPPETPERLIQQLKENGIMVLPVGEKKQKLLRITKKRKAYKKSISEMFVLSPCSTGSTDSA